MYWTRPSSVEFFSGDGSISRAGMDGSGVTVLVPNLNEPKGIAIDFQSSRLYWTVPLDGKVKSSDMQGKDIRTVMKFPSDSYTNGIGLFGNRIYVTNRLSRTLESFTTAGQDLQVLHTDMDTNLLFNLAIIVSPRPDLPRNRTNHCENHGCTKVCVLTRTSSRCVDWNGYNFRAYEFSGLDAIHVDWLIWIVSKIVTPGVSWDGRTITNKLPNFFTD